MDPTSVPRQVSEGGRRKVIRVAVVDENDIFRRGLVACLETDEALLVVHEAPFGPVPDGVDVVLASARAAPGPTGSETAEGQGEGQADGQAGRPVEGPPRLICADPCCLDGQPGRPPADAVLSRSRLTEEQLLAAVHAAACGLQLRGARPVRAEARAADALTDRMRQVLALLADRCGTREIADRIGFSERTVKSVVQQAQYRLGARSRAQAVATAIRDGLI